jgi:S-adenosylmethionine:tRNA ribosyltransferase-isomerase
MRTELFDFELPQDRIALRPVHPRDAARMLVVRPSSMPCTSRTTTLEIPLPQVLATIEASFEDRMVRDLPKLLQPGDALVLNDTRVIAASLEGVRTRNGNAAHVLFNLIKQVGDSRWRAFARPARRLELGDTIIFRAEGRVCFADALDATIVAKSDTGEVELAFRRHGAYLDEAIAAIGDMPLPHYIASKRKPDEADRASYQTIYARKDGAVAAPTAGLHFTEELFAALNQCGISRHYVTLHVGAGTFLPVKSDDTADHRMHAEWGEVTPEAASALNAVRANGGRIVAVGTTSLRVLESAACDDGMIQPMTGDTSLFIMPGYRFKAVDLLMTNFHLPRSTLFMLAAAFSGLKTMRAAYAHAIASNYRFYSYGDATLLFPTMHGGRPNSANVGFFGSEGSLVKQAIE